MADKYAKYTESVEEVLKEIADQNSQVDWDDFVVKAKDLIIGSYTNRNLNVFRGEWKQLFSNVASSLQYTIKKDSGSRSKWTLISDALKQTRSLPVTASSSPANKPSTSASKPSTSASKSSASANKHNALVTANEKAKLLERVSKLNESQKWKLSSGKFVEDAVCEVISKCHYDHPALHFVVDPSDAIWKEAFTKEEINEIRNFKAPALPALDEDIQSYLDSFDSAQLKSAKDVYDYACKSKFEFGTNNSKRWIQKSFIEAAELFEDSSKINLSDFSEGDLMNKLWQFVYRCYRSSSVDAKLGERVSIASSLARNHNRCLEGLDRRERKASGAKVDILFKAGRHEVGCCEVGKEDVLSIDDKYLDDGMTKLPKTLRDMLSRLVEVNPVQINKLYTVGFLMMGLQLEMLIVDVPAGSTVVRVTRTKGLSFPDHGEDIVVDLTALLETVLIGRKMMENVEDLLVKSKKRKAVELRNDCEEESAALLLPYLL
ncbi:hypothetical protein BD560DRAFT_487647 [Blakeslea trispora]|nr:hypothetical protein BD560DRAFT_487647 [Blakeslea trispora]